MIIVSGLIRMSQDGIRASGETYNGVVTTDGAWLGSQRVGGTEDDTAGLDDVTALPDHGADWAGTHVYMHVSLPSLRY